jgi:predicted extracellular nuclease
VLDANPEAIIVGSPLDASSNPKETKMGDKLVEITGIVSYAFGFYRVLPLTKMSIDTPAVADAPPASLVSTGDCRGITVAAYNTENLAPTSAHLPLVAGNIVNNLKLPDIVFLQEVQDNNGATNDAVVDANVTLSTLTAEIERLSGVIYDFTSINPVDDQDGGQPGGNIRVAYLYRANVVELYKPSPGGSTDANEVLPGPELKYNPGRIDPAKSVWSASRKPLAAMWRAIKGPRSKIFFTVNVHFSSKGGSSSPHGDPRPPVNGAIANRQAQVEVAGVRLFSMFSNTQ